MYMYNIYKYILYIYILYIYIYIHILCFPIFFKKIRLVG